MGEKSSKQRKGEGSEADKINKPLAADPAGLTSAVRLFYFFYFLL